MISTEPTALIPVTLLTGFLGSGKTTVLNHVLKQPGMAATAVNMAGQRRPETFNFLGFTHYCSKTRNGKFVVRRKTQAKRLVRKLKAIREYMLDRMHTPVRERSR